MVELYLHCHMRLHLLSARITLPLPGDYAFIYRFVFSFALSLKSTTQFRTHVCLQHPLLPSIFSGSPSLDIHPFPCQSSKWLCSNRFPHKNSVFISWVPVLAIFAEDRSLRDFAFQLIHIMVQSPQEADSRSAT
jgi:hypothetical protein